MVDAHGRESIGAQRPLKPLPLEVHGICSNVDIQKVRRLRFLRVGEGP